MTAVMENSVHVQIQIVEGRDRGCVNFLVNERVALGEPPVEAPYPHLCSRD